jgi:hypothetical protein
MEESRNCLRRPLRGRIRYRVHGVDREVLSDRAKPDEQLPGQHHERDTGCAHEEGGEDSSESSAQATSYRDQIIQRGTELYVRMNNIWEEMTLWIPRWII